MKQNLVCFLACFVTLASGQTQDHAAKIGQIIDQIVKPALPSGFKGMIVGYQDDSGQVFKSYGVATVDGTVPLNEKTIFGIGSATKLFSATLLALANGRGLALNTPALSLLPSQYPIAAGKNRFGIRLVDLAVHHAGLPKNEGHLYSSVNDLYADYAADPVTCNPGTSELIHDCGCCDPAYMSLLGLSPTCGTGVANPVYTCPTHAATQGAKGWVYSNLGFEILGTAVAKWLGYNDWNTANLQEITIPLNMPDTLPLESLSASQATRTANHCNPATYSTNTNCQLLDWLPVGNPGGGLFSTATDMLKFASYNAKGTSDPAAAKLAAALPVIHQNYEQSPTGGQELGWQNFNLPTGEVEHWKDGSNGPFNSWTAYVPGSLTRMVVILDNSGTSAADLGPIAKQILINTGPSIGSVTTANGGADISQNDWIVIKGSNLVPASTVAGGMDWGTAPEFAAGKMPIKLGDVSVTVNGQPAFVYFYCSAVTSTVCTVDQINALSPLGIASGPVDVVVTNSGVQSPAFSVNVKSQVPSLLEFTPQGYVVATHLNYSLLGPTSLYPPLSTPAKPGEIVLVYGVGWGLPNGTLTNGSSSQTGTLPTLPVCQIAGQSAPVTYAGLSSPGLYILAVTIPNGAPNGDSAISCTYNGAATPAGNLITVQR